MEVFVLHVDHKVWVGLSICLIYSLMGGCHASLCLPVITLSKDNDNAYQSNVVSANEWGYEKQGGCRFIGPLKRLWDSAGTRCPVSWSPGWSLAWIHKHVCWWGWRCWSLHMRDILATSREWQRTEMGEGCLIREYKDKCLLKKDYSAVGRQMQSEIRQSETDIFLHFPQGTKRTCILEHDHESELSTVFKTTKKSVIWHSKYDLSLRVKCSVRFGLFVFGRMLV